MASGSVPSELNPSEALETLRARIIGDGFPLIVDLQSSHGPFVYDALSGQEYLDFYAFFGSQPIAYNHAKLRDPGFQSRLLTAATTKTANSEIYTEFYAAFVKTLDEVAGLPRFEHFFFIDGGALGVENALKAAFDWKVRKNLAAGRGEIGHRVIHFRESFHGRTGYTLSLTNTAEAAKIMYFPKFDWPRIDNPRIDFSLPEPQRTADVAAREVQAVKQIEEAIRRYPHDIAALIIEPIQGEGGDNHFRPEFFKKLRRICDDHDLMLIFDEVQVGGGGTGKWWCCQHFGVLPDMLCFGKKMQVCGLMANRRVDEVEHVFKVSGRLNSTWGGNLADMVRSTQFMRIIQEENLLAAAARKGEYLLGELQRLAENHPIMSAPRGRGLLCAFDLPDRATRDALKRACFERKMLILGCGERALRFRPMLDIQEAFIDRGLAILDDALRAVE